MTSGVVGAAYIYQSSNCGLTWSYAEKILAHDGVENANFGYAVAIMNRTVVVGAPYDNNEKGTQAGTLFCI